MSKGKLLESIEEYREELATLVCIHGLSSEIVIKTSKELDILINKYQKNYQPIHNGFHKKSWSSFT